MARPASAPGNNANDLKPVAITQCSSSELRWRHRLAVTFHNHAARQKTLRSQELLDAAREIGCDWLAVRDDRSLSHHVSVRKLTSGGQLMRIPNTLPMPLVM